jgi:hypothetical protein
MTTASPKTFAERDAWVRAVLASDLPHRGVRLAIRIAMHLHVETGRCDPSITTLAAGTRFSERAVYRWVAVLERAGWIGIEHTRGQTNRYALLTPDTSMARVDDVTPDTLMAGVESVTPATGDAAPLPPTAPDPCQYTGSQKALNSEENSEEESESPPSENSQFERFWVAYPKRVARRVAAKAFAAALKRADVETIIAGALRYATERASEDPKFTKHPSTWLNGDCWEDAPSRGNGVTIDGATGEVVATGPPPRPPGQRKTGAELARDVIAKYGNRTYGHGR